ncbi:MAG: branched-chain amino acid ABC transporter permease [Acidimicrobiales bacterium]|nr:branched-chain amino acid ABC transporter permease [Acidimicrobiales bacterium]MXY04141.1 branched-chain amino acid ABC transporter permease [Acidimicrobiales bacterium]MYD35028.1 branched-chain amino acid ABC transporter permease [Acidimicrobiales bacterium]MYG87990.1 branched-chain amino acid ABC transporter permease [Acidimicrobiales bacterium]MYI08514.1 branched-chain amino acid ABC transporter permease [Acidimicrobiales bacterium]
MTEPAPDLRESSPAAGRARRLLRADSRSRWPLVLTAVVLASLAVAPAWVQAVDRAYLVTMLTRIVIFGLAAMSLDLVVGYGGMVSLGHAAFFGAGAYTAGALTYHSLDGSTLLGVPGTQQALVTWPAAAVLGALLGAMIGGLCLRTTGVYFIMATLAFNQMVYFLFNALEVYGGDDGVGLFAAGRSIGPLDASDDVTYFYVCFAVLAAFVVVLNLMVRSPFGRVLRGCRDNPARMAALGFHTYRYRLVAFIISASISSLAGAMAVTESQFLSPSFAKWTESGELLVMVILGGLGSLVGGIVGAAALFVLEEFAIDITDNWQFFVGVGLLAVVLAAPRGLTGLVLGRGRRNV